MCKVFFLVLAALALCHGSPVESEGQRDSRMLGGSKAAEGSAPFMVSLRYTNNHVFCGGTIITPRTILTSGECIRNITPNYTKVIVGTNNLSTGGTNYEISEKIVHKNYDSLAKNDNIGLIILSTPIEMSDLVKPIILSEVETGADVFVNLTGWGSGSFTSINPSNDLRTMNLKTITNKACWEEAHAGMPFIFESNICTFNKMYDGACHGDQGSPLVDIATGAQVGILSWFYNCAKGFPDVYTRVSFYISWINENKVD